MRGEYTKVVHCAKAGFVYVGRNVDYPQVPQRRFPGSAEFAVSTMFLILLVIAFSLAVLLAAGTLFIQGYIYSAPADDIYWRAPAAAAAVTVFLGFWCFLNYRAADAKATELPYDTLFTSAATEDASYPVAELWVERAGGRTHYRRYTIPGVITRFEYRDSGDKRLTHDKSVVVVIIKEGDPKESTETRFLAQTETSRYFEEGGPRYMTVDNFGRIYTPRPGRSRVMLFINLVHLGVWFLVLWLLLRFQWLHALGLALVFWLAMTWLVVPQILAKVPRKPAEPVASAQTFHRVGELRLQDRRAAGLVSAGVNPAARSFV
jgi:hypothetical protein